MKLNIIIKSLTQVLRKTEDMLARETLTRSSLETQKLELMSEVANLKLRQTAIDRENMDLRKRLAKTLDLSTAATAALAAAANAAAASNQNHHLSSSTGKFYILSLSISNKNNVYVLYVYYILQITYDFSVSKKLIRLNDILRNIRILK